jgi:peptidoglycan/LPS O-acetylase OafA/YrhL
MADGPDRFPAGGRLPSLDGIRAIAILVVVYSHAHGTDGFPSWLQWSLPDGSAAVRAFFVLSGFLITSLMLRERSRAGRVSLVRFYRRRAVRILPVYWAFLAFVALLWAAGTVALRPANLLAPLTFTNGFGLWGRPPAAWVTLHTWSLAVEEQFYLCWPLAFVVVTAVVPRRAGQLVLLALLGGVLVAGPIARAHMYLRPWQAQLIYAMPGNVDILGWGCALALAWDAFPAAVERCLAWRPAVGRAAALAVVLYGPMVVGRAYGYEYGWSAWGAQALAVAYLIASLVHVRRGASYRLLNSRPMVRLGVLSYGLYLWQQPFLESFSGAGHAPHTWQRWPLNLGCALATAMLSYRLVERPMRRFRPASAMASDRVDDAPVPCPAETVPPEA